MYLLHIRLGIPRTHRLPSRQNPPRVGILSFSVGRIREQDGIMVAFRKLSWMTKVVGQSSWQSHISCETLGAGPPICLEEISHHDFLGCKKMNLAKKHTTVEGPQAAEETLV